MFLNQFLKEEINKKLKIVNLLALSLFFNVVTLFLGEIGAVAFVDAVAAESPASSAPTNGVFDNAYHLTSYQSCNLFHELTFGVLFSASLMTILSSFVILSVICSGLAKGFGRVVCNITSSGRSHVTSTHISYGWRGTVVRCDGGYD